MTRSLSLNYHIIKVSGQDASDFLSGQLTSDIQKLKNNQSQHSARLNVKGQVKCFFHLGKIESDYFIIISEKFATGLCEDLDKYIIAEDVELSTIAEKCVFIFGSGFSKFCDDKKTYIQTEFLAKFGCFIWNDLEQINEKAKSISKDEENELIVKSGYPSIMTFSSEKYFINNLILNELAISYDKGCFLGQEPVAKIENNRGGSHYPMAFMLNNDQAMPDDDIMSSASVFSKDKKIGQLIDMKSEEFLSLSLLRDFRITGREFTFTINDKDFKGKVSSFPLNGTFNRSDFIQDSYLKSLKNYNSFNMTEESILDLEDLYFLDPSNKDVCEALGAILGNCSRYKEAIAYMDHLEAIDPDYGMANTNKSVYYMKIGEIEKAEKEKEYALLKSFKTFGKESDEKEREQKFQKEEIEKREKRKNMFLQVLDLDAEDTVANYGLANILFIEEDLQTALSHVKKVVEKDKKYSVAYLLMGKILEKSGQELEAKKVYESGIIIASANGDMQPANEMQYRMNLL